MNTKLIEFAANMGITADTIRIALGQKPDLSRQLEDVTTFEEGAKMLELTKKDGRMVYIATIWKMISFIRDAASLQEFINIIWRYPMTKEQADSLPAIFNAYGNDLVKSMATTSDLRSLLSSYGKRLNDVLMEKIRYKILLLEAERITSLETVEQCYQDYHSVGPDFQRLLVARANSLLVPLLKEINTVEKAWDFLCKPFLTEEMREKAGELYRQLVRRRINDRTISWKKLEGAFSTAENHIPGKTLERRALIRMAREAKSEFELEKVIKILYRKDIGSNNRLYNDVHNRYDMIIEAKMLKAETVYGCFMLHGHSATRSERLKLAAVNRALKLASTVEDYLSIENLMGNWQSFEGLNVRETVDYCLNTALYLTSSLNEWRLVWGRCKQKLGEFGQKCLRRFAIIVEEEKGIQPQPIVDGLYVIDLNLAA